MTPAIRTLEKAQIPFTLHPYEPTGEADSYGLEAATALGVDPDQVFKTLVVRTEGAELILAMVPVSGRLDLKELARAPGERKMDKAECPGLGGSHQPIGGQ